VAADFPTSLAVPLPHPGGTIYHDFCKCLLKPFTQHRSFALSARHGKRRVASAALLTLARAGRENPQNDCLEAKQV